MRDEKREEKKRKKWRVSLFFSSLFSPPPPTNTIIQMDIRHYIDNHCVGEKKEKTFFFSVGERFFLEREDCGT